MHSDKAPGPDGLNPAFYQKFWHLIGNDISDGYRLWLQQGTFPPSLTDTLIVLIPKVQNPEYIKDFLPIALCNVLYKIVAKALANRFKSVLPVIISENQSAFVPNRLITDNVMIAFEMSI